MALFLLRVLGRRGFTLVEILVVVAIIALLAVSAVPGLLRARTTANETAAIGNLKALFSSLVIYHTAHNSYPAVSEDWNDALYADAEPDYGPPAFNQELDGSAVVQGYAYEYIAYGAGMSFVLRASPDRLGQTGTRTFWVSDEGVLFHCTGGDTSDYIPGAAVPMAQPPGSCP